MIIQHYIGKRDFLLVVVDNVVDLFVLLVLMSTAAGVSVVCGTATARVVLQSENGVRKIYTVGKKFATHANSTDENTVKPETTATPKVYISADKMMSVSNLSGLAEDDLPIVAEQIH